MMTPHDQIRPQGHPFRARLPRAVALPAEESELKLFAVSFTAFFVCFYTFLI